MIKMNNVAAVIVAYNDYDSVRRCIDSLENQIKYVCVIDNSTIIDRFYHENKNIKYFKNDENVGLGRALNKGIKEFQNYDIDWIMLLDQDSILDKNMVNELLNSYKSSSDENIVQIVPNVYDNNTNKYLPSLIYKGFLLKKIFYPHKDTYIDFQITSGSLIKKDLFSQIGYMDEYFFIDYIDYDYCFRIRNNGYKILLSKNAILNHSLGEKNTKFGIPYVQHSNIRIFYQVRNRLILIKRYGKSFPSFAITQFRNLILKFLKIIFLEDDKKIKIKNFIYGLFMGIKYSEKINK